MTKQELVANIHDEIKNFIKSHDENQKLKLEVASMGMIDEAISGLSLTEVGELDRNGWDSDYFKNYYHEETDTYYLIIASGYYGHAEMMEIDECEVDEPD